MKYESELILALLVGTIIITLLAIFIILFVILYKRAQLKHQLETQSFQQALLQAEVEIREQTMADISRDLHDNFGQIASLIKMQLAMVSTKAENADKERLKECNELLSQLIGEIRSLSTSLNAQRLHQIGLYEMIEKDLERISKLGQLKLEFLSEPLDVSIDTQASVFLYRMFQEMMNNVLKHSEATKAQVSLEQEQGNLVLRVEDNGIGIQENLPQKSRTDGGGNGILNIKERCRILGAGYKIRSSPKNGTFIEVKLPI